MFADYHIHTPFCDGKNTPEEIVLSAVEKGISSIGFSGHGYTPFDLRYCMKNVPEYINEVNRLKKKYENEIEIYCGVEEDAFSYMNRNEFDYIIGSSHYFNVDGNYYPIDSNYDYFKKCLEVFNFDIPKLSETYFTAFTEYIRKRKPDIVGHFDLITKFDEIDTQYFLNNKNYFEIAKKYLQSVAGEEVIFELNTGAMAREIRKTQYLGEELLHTLHSHGGKVVLSSDSHCVDTLCYRFEDMIHILREVGFSCVYELRRGKFVKRNF